MQIDDLSAKTYNTHEEDGYTYLSVGWLGDQVKHEDVTHAEVFEILEALKERNQFYDGWMGLHKCELCANYMDKGEFYVENGTTRYVLPNMVMHYITDHRYRLPTVVEEAILKSAQV
jgi:hypothetical protein